MRYLRIIIPLVALLGATFIYIAFYYFQNNKSPMFVEIKTEQEALQQIEKTIGSLKRNPDLADFYTRFNNTDEERNLRTFKAELKEIILEGLPGIEIYTPLWEKDPTLINPHKVWQLDWFAKDGIGYTAYVIQNTGQVIFINKLATQEVFISDILESPKEWEGKMVRIKYNAFGATRLKELGLESKLPALPEINAYGEFACYVDYDPRAYVNNTEHRDPAPLYCIYVAPLSSGAFDKLTTNSEMEGKVSVVRNIPFITPLNP